MRIPILHDSQRLLDRTAANMLACGWAVTGILAQPASGSRAFAYTAGFSTTLGVPEVAIVGLPHEVACHLLNDLGKRLRSMPPDERARAIADGATMSGLLAHGLDVSFRSLGTCAKAGYFSTTAAVMGHRRFEVLQMLWPDTDNKLPTDPSCDQRMSAMQAWPPSNN